MHGCYNRPMGEKLLLVPWIMGILYSSIPLFWFAIHPVAPRWQQMRRSPYRVLLPLWMVIIIALGVLTWPWHASRIYETPWAWLPAIVFSALGASTYFRIRSEFGTTNFIGESELRPHEHPQTLVTTGLHARMRHPIYVAHLCVFAAWTLGSGLLINVVLLATGTLITFPLMIWMEERELEKRFGQNYREYRQIVPLIPGFNLHRTSANGKHAAN